MDVIICITITSLFMSIVICLCNNISICDIIYWFKPKFWIIKDNQLYEVCKYIDTNGNIHYITNNHNVISNINIIELKWMNYKHF